MPAQSVSVNLLDQPEFKSSSIARLMNWAITYGRYIMIGTEVIVLIAFVSRFSLDRKLTDLREEIAQKQIILEANQQFEEEYKHLQETLSKIKVLVNNQDKPTALFYQISATLPIDVLMSSYHAENNKLNIHLLAGTTEGFSLFLKQIQNVPSVTDIEVTEIKKDKLRGTEFRIIARVR